MTWCLLGLIFGPENQDLDCDYVTWIGEFLWHKALSFNLFFVLEASRKILPHLAKPQGKVGEILHNIYYIFLLTINRTLNVIINLYITLLVPMASDKYSN